MASSPKKTLSLPDKKKASKKVERRKSSKPESSSGSADFEFNFNYLDLSRFDHLVNNPKIKELAEKLDDIDQIAEDFRRILPRIALLKEKFPDFDPEECINIICENARKPGTNEFRDKFFNHLLPDRQMSAGTLHSKTPDPAIGGEDKV